MSASRFTSIAGFALVMALMLGGCASTRVLRDFSTDGCSLFPDGTREHPQQWCDCCVSHDAAYWRGGTAAERENADAALRDCVQMRSDIQSLDENMYRGVRVGGGPLLPTRFRWAYGWGYGRGYEPLTSAERQQADEKLKAYQNSQAGAICQSP